MGEGNIIGENMPMPGGEGTRSRGEKTKTPIESVKGALGESGPDGERSLFGKNQKKTGSIGGLGGFQLRTPTKPVGSFEEAYATLSPATQEAVKEAIAAEKDPVKRLELRANVTSSVNQEVAAIKR